MKTPNTNSRISLKNIKYSEAFSRETRCFSAAVYFDGKKAATVEDDGHGGALAFRFSSKEQAVALQEYAAGLDPVPTVLGGHELPLPCDLEMVVNDLLTDWIIEQDFKKAVGKRLLFTKVGETGVYQTNPLPKNLMNTTMAVGHERVKAKLNAAVVLNFLPAQEALAIYKGAA